MVGADLKNLINEAALPAARRDHERVAEPGLHRRAREDHPRGERAASCCRPRSGERTAYHESGHALLGMLIPGADPVRKISIVPRGRALGVTFQSPDADRYGYGAETTCAGGSPAPWADGRRRRSSTATSPPGPESDLEQVTTSIAKRMVGRWGMSRRHRPGFQCCRELGQRHALDRGEQRWSIGGHARAGRSRGAPHRRRLLCKQYGC